MKNTIQLLFSISLSFMVFGLVQAQSLKVNTEKSNIRWYGEEITVKAHFGNLTLKSCTLDLQNDIISGGSFTVNMTSLSVEDLSGGGKAKLEGHIKSDDFFSVENNPEVEITMEKVLYNHYLLWQLATNGVSLSIPAVPLDKRSTLLARSRERCNVFLGVFKETEETIRSPTNLQEIEIWCTGMYINNISYTFPTDGNCTESITLVGNHKSWSTNQNIKAIASAQFGNNVNNGYVDVPATGTQTGIGGTASFGGVARRENVRIQNCRFPDIIPGAARGSQPTTFNACKIQSISISCDLGREDVFVLGRKMPYIRTANYPVEVTCEIEVLSGNADSINVGESLDSQNRIIDTYSVLDYPLVIVMDNGLKFDLGYVKLSSVSYSGADAGGGNGATTYSFTGYNVLDIAG